ncbi:MAG TPA: hypothetical protein VJP85_07500 [Candidatus Baltobacteraceae bacterium]|nr:hypothetical protein [Candidatus Baltobacteraceae bacterium]
MWPLVLAVGVGLIVLNVVVCVAVVVNPEDAASVLAKRSNWLALGLYYSVLSFSYMDPQRDLASSTPFPALVQNCRRRALRRLQLFFAGAVIIVLVSISNGHAPALWSR